MLAVLVDMIGVGLVIPTLPQVTRRRRISRRSMAAPDCAAEHGHRRHDCAVWPRGHLLRWAVCWSCSILTHKVVIAFRFGTADRRARLWVPERSRWPQEHPAAYVTTCEEHQLARSRRCLLLGSLVRRVVRLVLPDGAHMEHVAAAVLPPTGTDSYPCG